MKFVIITNVEKHDNAFVRGIDTVRTIVHVKQNKIDIKDNYIEDNLATESAEATVITIDTESLVKDDTENLVKDDKETILLKYISTFMESDLSILTKDITLKDMSTGSMFLVKAENGFDLNIIDTTTNTTWYTTYSNNTSRTVGHFYTMSVCNDLDIETERVVELNNNISKIMKEKNDILAQSCTLESDIASIQSENKFLKKLADKYRDQIESTNSNYEECMTKINILTDRVNKKNEIHIHPHVNQRFSARNSPRNVANDNIPFEIINFDKTKLRNVRDLTASVIL